MFVCSGLEDCERRWAEGRNWGWRRGLRLSWRRSSGGLVENSAVVVCEVGGGADHLLRRVKAITGEYDDVDGVVDVTEGSADPSGADEDDSVRPREGQDAANDLCEEYFIDARRIQNSSEVNGRVG